MYLHTVVNNDSGKVVYNNQEVGVGWWQGEKRKNL